MRASWYAVTGILAWATAAPHLGYLRYPDTHGELVVFCAEGDLWVGRRDGSLVRRLTSHPGDETVPILSPDGTMVAFAGEYDGNRDVYLVPTEGGEPRRLTWHPDPDFPVAWAPDGQALFFLSPRESPHGATELYRVDLQGGEPCKVPLGEVSGLAIDPVSGRWALTRLRGGGTWKRYRGGTAPDIWVGHPDSGFSRVTTFEGMDCCPMWHGGRLYFASDRGGTVNIWSMLPDGGDLRPHTFFQEWDLRWPAMGPDGTIAFGLAGDVWLFHPEDGSVDKLPLVLPSDRVLTRVRYPDPSAYLTEFTLSPPGDRVAVVSRGEVFSVPVKRGVTLRLTQGSGAREHKVCYDGTGQRLAFVTDESGEEAIVVGDAWGRQPWRRVSPDGEAVWHSRPAWSPDGTFLAYGDHAHRLWVLELKTGATHQVDYCPQAEITDYSWSPDGRWLAYVFTSELDMGSIRLFDTKTKTHHWVTDPTTHDFGPVWDPQGRYLCFLSARFMDPIIGDVDFEAVVVNSAKPCLVLLRPDVKNPLGDTAGLPGSEEEERSPPEATKERPKIQRASTVSIELEGLPRRVVELPVPAGSYSHLSCTGDKLFYLAWPLRGLQEAEREPRQGTLWVFDLKKRKQEVFARGVSAYELAIPSGKLAFMKRRGELYVVDSSSPPRGRLEEAKVDLSGLVVELDPREEWRQIYLEAWRTMRDFYWDQSMQGLDWQGLRDQYASLLPRIATREELRDLIAELVGELATSHTYVWGGDIGRQVPRYPVGVLGAKVAREGSAFRVVRILRGGPPDRVRSPLDEPGAEVREGDYILAVNHHPFRPELPFEASMVNLADKPVLLTVNSRPDTLGARHVVVKPLREERSLLYADWVRRNREYVAQRTQGRVGYVHIPDMGARGLQAFHTWYFPQLDKEGLIVDVRYNGGGFVSQLILSRLKRRLLSWDRLRTGATIPYPYRVLNGPFVVITNEHAGSDGDIFPAAVQMEGLAPIIGTRSWGGVIGIRGGWPLVDGGALTHPEFAWWDARRGWGLENRGVEPDIVVENKPQDVAAGVDAQLERAIEEVLRLCQERPPQRPSFGPAPDRSRRAYAHELEPPRSAAP